MASTGKGSTFERDVAVLLSKWWTGGARDDVFWRVGGSGGRATNRFRRKNKQTANQEGDITATDEIGMTLINKSTWELKTGYDKWCISDEVDKQDRMKPQVFSKFLAQACGYVDKTRKWPIVVFRRPLRQPCIALPAALMAKISSIQKTRPAHPRMTVTLETGETWAVLRLEAFFKWCSPSTWEHINLQE